MDRHIHNSFAEHSPVISTDCTNHDYQRYSNNSDSEISPSSISNLEFSIKNYLSSSQDVRHIQLGCNSSSPISYQSESNPIDLKFMDESTSSSSSSLCDSVMVFDDLINSDDRNFNVGVTTTTLATTMTSTISNHASFFISSKSNNLASNKSYSCKRTEDDGTMPRIPIVPVPLGVSIDKRNLTQYTSTNSSNDVCVNDVDWTIKNKIYNPSISTIKCESVAYGDRLPMTNGHSFTTRQSHSLAQIFDDEDDNVETANSSSPHTGPYPHNASLYVCPSTCDSVPQTAPVRHLESTHGAAIEEADSDDNFLLMVSDSDNDSLAESIYHQPPKAADRSAACRLAKRLYHLDGFRITDVAKHLSKRNDFSQLVGEEFASFFNLSNQRLDIALRTFLNSLSLTGESQERERVLIHFSRRYHACNPNTFINEDACHTLVCALMLLNADLQDQNLSKRMSCDEFVHNLGLMQFGDSYSRDDLTTLYNAIKQEPIRWPHSDASNMMNFVNFYYPHSSNLVNAFGNQGYPFNCNKFSNVFYHPNQTGPSHFMHPGSIMNGIQSNIIPLYGMSNQNFRVNTNYSLNSGRAIVHAPNNSTLSTANSFYQMTDYANSGMYPNAPHDLGTNAPQVWSQSSLLPSINSPSIGGNASTVSTTELQAHNKKHLLDFSASNILIDLTAELGAKEYMRGLLGRKWVMESHGKRTPMGRRGWKLYYARLRDLVLYFYKNATAANAAERAEEMNFVHQQYQHQTYLHQLAVQQYYFYYQQQQMVFHHQQQQQQQLIQHKQDAVSGPLNGSLESTQESTHYNETIAQVQDGASSSEDVGEQQKPDDCIKNGCESNQADVCDVGEAHLSINGVGNNGPVASSCTADDNGMARAVKISDGVNVNVNECQSTSINDTPHCSSKLPHTSSTTSNLNLADYANPSLTMPNDSPYGFPLPPLPPPPVAPTFVPPSIPSPETVIGIAHAYASAASDYAKKPNVFRLYTKEGAEFLFEVNDAKEIDIWVNRINFAAALLSAPPLTDFVSSDKNIYRRPHLPVVYSKLNMREQLEEHQRCLLKLDQEIADLRNRLQQSGLSHLDGKSRKISLGSASTPSSSSSSSSSSSAPTKDEQSAATTTPIATPAMATNYATESKDASAATASSLTRSTIASSSLSTSSLISVFSTGSLGRRRKTSCNSAVNSSGLRNSSSNGHLIILSSKQRAEYEERLEFLEFEVQRYKTYAHLLETELFRMQQFSMNGGSNYNSYTANYGLSPATSPVYVLPHSAPSSIACPNPVASGSSAPTHDYTMQSGAENTAIPTKDVALGPLSNGTNKKTAFIVNGSNSLRSGLAPSYLQPQLAPNVITPNPYFPNVTGRFYPPPPTPPTPPIVPHPSHHLPRRWKQSSNLNQHNMYVYVPGGHHPYSTAQHQQQSHNQLTEEDPSVSATADSHDDDDNYDKDVAGDDDDDDDDDNQTGGCGGNAGASMNGDFVPSTWDNDKPTKSNSDNGSSTNATDTTSNSEVPRYHLHHHQTVLSRLKTATKSNAQSDRGLFYEIV